MKLSLFLCAQIWVLLAAVVFSPTEGAIHRYKKGAFKPYLDAMVYGGAKEGMRSTRISQNKTDEIIERWVEHPASGMSKHSTDGFSYIKFDDLKFIRTKDKADKYKAKKYKKKKTGLVQVLIFEVNNLYEVGHISMDKKTHTLCCTSELAPIIGCKKDSLILQPTYENQTWPLLLDVHFESNHEVAHMENMLIDITETGLYNLWFLSCDPHFRDSKLFVSGKTIWKNPSGYLPGMMLPMIPMYGILSLAYLALGFTWIVLLLRNFKDVIVLQICISVVILLSMLETSLWYFDYVNFNNTGTRPAAITFWAVLFGAIRKVVAKVTLLLVCMGYGVVKPTLGQNAKKIYLLTAAYLAATLLLDMLSHIGNIDDISDFGRVTVILPVAALDGVMILWIFTSLTKIITQLENRNQKVKLEMYRKLYKALMSATGLAVTWMMYEMYFRVFDASDMKWKSEWQSSCFWKSMTFVLTVVVCFLWGPSKVSARYAYSEQLDGDTGLELTTTESGIKPNADSAFSLEDDEEEDKIE